MVKKTATVLLLIWFVLVLFMPKEELYFSLEKELVKNDIELNEESRSEGVFSLRLKNVTVYVKGIPLVTVEKIDFFTLLFYTSIHFETLMIDESLKTMTPTEIEDLLISQSILAPLNLSVKAEGPFGEASGSVDLDKRMLRMDFNDTKALGMLQSKLKQGEEGWYYETSF
jgi:hypothetical protein